MSNWAKSHNIGHFLHILAAGKGSTYESGSYVSGTSVSGTGYVIDRNSLPRWYGSAKVSLGARADMASGKRFDLTFKLQHSTASGSGFASLATGSAQLINSTTATSVIQSKTAALSVDLRAAKRYLRVKWTHYGNGNTATGSGLNLCPVVAFGGAEQTPASSTEA